MSKNSRIMIISDLHVPFHHKDSLEFLKAAKKKYKPTRIIFTGDEVDYHSMSFHDSDPDILFSASGELEKAIWYLQDFYKEFPEADILDSNHGSLVYRKAKHHGIPRRVFKSYNEILEAPKKWKWHNDMTIKMSNGQNLYLHHGHSKNVLKNSQQKSMCYAMGHHHSVFDIQYWANSENLYWGMTVGCLIDSKEYAFNYARNNLPKALLGCGMVIDGLPKLIPMILNKRGKWTGKII